MTQNEPPKTFYLDPKEIKLRERIRRQFDEKRAQELAKSIAEKGQIHPAVLDEDGFLISGERRTRACTHLGIKVLCIQRADLDQAAAFELELEENLTREDLTPQEVVRARAQLYKLKGGGKPRLGGQSPPTLDEIAQQMGITKGQLSQDLKIALWLDVIPELSECSTKTEMLAKVKHLEAQAQWNAETDKIRKETGLAIPSPPPLHPDVSHLLDKGPTTLEGGTTNPADSARPNPLAFMELSPGTSEWKQHWRAFPEAQHFMLAFSKAWESGEEWSPPPECLALANAPRPEVAAPTRIETGIEDLKKHVLQTRFGKADLRLLVGKAEEILSTPLPWGKPTIIFFDPPWGIGHDEKLNGTGSGYDTYCDSPDYSTPLFHTMAQLLYDQAADNAHLYTFFSIANHEAVYSALEAAGWTTNRRPIIWAKPGIRSTRVPEYWPGASYEPIAFARKGNKPLIQKKGDFIDGIKPPPPSQKGHPAAKPPELYLDLLARSACMRDLVLDPCFGSGPVFRACELFHQMQLEWCGIELEETWKNLALVKLMELWTGKQEGELSDKLSLFGD